MNVDHKYFTIPELMRSDLAVRKGIDNTPPEEALKDLHRLADYLDERRTDRLFASARATEAIV